MRSQTLSSDRKSCWFAAMDIIRNWCNSGSESIQSGETVSLNSTASRRSKWKLLWNKLIKKKKERIVEASGSVKVPYDEYSYLQNFDRGVPWDEPEGFFRSFSGKYADSSNKVSLKKKDDV